MGVLIIPRQRGGAGFWGRSSAAGVATGCCKEDFDAAALARGCGHVDVVFVVLARGAGGKMRTAVQGDGTVAGDGETASGGAADVALELGCWGGDDAASATGKGSVRLFADGWICFLVLGGVMGGHVRAVGDGTARINAVGCRWKTAADPVLAVVELADGSSSGSGAGSGQTEAACTGAGDEGIGSCHKGCCSEECRLHDG